MRFEEVCKEWIDKTFKLIEDNRESFDKIDFIFEYKQRKIALDCKEKKSESRGKWSELTGVPRENLFVFDETSIKKIFSHFPFGFMLIFDGTKNNYSVFNSLDLLCLPRRRLNRVIFKEKEMLKGKWIVDLNWGHNFSNMESGFEYIQHFMDDEIDTKLNQLECYRVLCTEDIPVLGGEDYTRVKKYWDKDVHEK